MGKKKVKKIITTPNIQQLMVITIVSQKKKKILFQKQIEYQKNKRKSLEREVA